MHQIPVGEVHPASLPVFPFPIVGVHDRTALAPQRSLALTACRLMNGRLQQRKSAVGFVGGGCQVRPHLAPFPGASLTLGEVLHAMRDIRSRKRPPIKYSEAMWKKSIELLDAAQRISSCSPGNES